MALRVGRTHYVDFRIVDTSSNPVTGRLLTDLQTYFTVDNVASTDALALVELGSGRYSVTYTPSKAGYYFLEVYDPTYDVRVLDGEEIDDETSFFATSDVVDLTQDYGGAGALKPTVASPEDYTLYVFLSHDWQRGRQDPSYATASTQLDTQGNWKSTPLTVLHDTYHIVLMNQDGKVVVMSAFLKV